jgi:hypothetical protein
VSTRLIIIKDVVTSFANWILQLSVAQDQLPAVPLLHYEGNHKRADRSKNKIHKVDNNVTNLAICLLFNYWIMKQETFRVACLTVFAVALIGLID